MEINENCVKETHDEQFSVQRNKTYRYNMPLPHFHDAYEISLALTDGTLYYVEEKIYAVKNASVAVFNENEIHRTGAPDNILYDRFSLLFKPRFICELLLYYPELTDLFANRPADFENCVLLNDTQKAEATVLFAKILEYYENRNINSRELKIKLTLCEILLYINDIYRLNKINPPVKNYAHNNQLRGIPEYIRNNLTEDLSLNTLSLKFFISTQQLIKIFKNTIGMTPNQYITDCRIIKSREYLKQGFSVGKVCELVGYTDISGFIRTFRKRMGCTPKKYRRE